MSPLVRLPSCAAVAVARLCGSMSTLVELVSQQIVYSKTPDERGHAILIGGFNLLGDLYHMLEGLGSLIAQPSRYIVV